MLSKMDLENKHLESKILTLSLILSTSVQIDTFCS